MSRHPVLQVNRISKAYGEESVLNEISFKISEGEFLVIVGESGSGKSSLLKIMSGLLEAEGGEVLFEGIPIEGPDSRLVPGYEEIQLVHQQFDLHPYMTAEENIRRPLLGFTKDYQKEKLDELLKLSGLEDKHDKRPSELSGGQQQKLALSTALAVEPTVLLMDEPFSNLDPFSKQAFLRQIKEQTRRLGTTAVFVTHDTRDALAVADRIIVLSEKKIAQEGTPLEVYQLPVNESIARFFGPINTFKPEEWVKVFGGDPPESRIGIRPEHVELVASGEGVTGKIEELIFNGPTTHLLVRLMGKADLIEVVSPREVPQIGSQVFLKVREAFLTIF